MEIDQMKKQLQPCDLDHPYVFISYSSENKVRVWQDVLELQNRGYNVWVDEANLDKTNPTWRSDALKAITDINCKLVLFYLSGGSLVSDPCYQELQQTQTEAAQELHFGPVPFVVVEAVPVGNLTDFVQSLRERIERSSAEKTVRVRQAQTLFHFTRSFFPNNERVRVIAKDQPGRIGDYYNGLEVELKKLSASTRFSTEKRYRLAVEYLVSGNRIFAEQHLTACSREGCVPAQLMLAHIYFNGFGSDFRSTAGAEAMWMEAEKQELATGWKDTGRQKLKARFYSEALAYLLAAGDRFDDADSLFEASKLWTRKGSRPLALEALRRAQRLGDARAERYLNQLQVWSEEQVRSNAKKLNDEAPIQ